MYYVHVHCTSISGWDLWQYIKHLAEKVWKMRLFNCSFHFIHVIQDNWGADPLWHGSVACVMKIANRQSKEPRDSRPRRKSLLELALSVVICHGRGRCRPYKSAIVVFGNPIGKKAATPCAIFSPLRIWFGGHDTFFSLHTLDDSYKLLLNALLIKIWNKKTKQS